HNFSCLPEETNRHKGICPVCGKKLLQGVMHRVNDLGDRDFGYRPKGSVPFVNTIPLEEIIAETMEVGTASKKVSALYESMVAKNAEFDILLDLSEEEIGQIANPIIA